MIYNLVKDKHTVYIFYSMKVKIMRKILVSAIAIAIIGTSISSCGQVEETASNENEISSVSEVKSDYDSDINDENIKDNGASDDLSNNGDNIGDSSNILSSDLSGDASELSSGYEDVLRAYFDASNEGDYKKIIRTMFPDKEVEGMLKLTELGANNLEEELSANKTNYVITDIVEEGSMTNEELDQYMLYFDQVAGVFNKIEEYGGDVEALSDEQREELYNAFMGFTASEDDDIEHIYNVTEGYDVTVYYTNSGEPDEDYFFVYYVDGEGWKVNNTMRKFVKKSKQSATNATAKTIFNFIAATLTDIEVSGTDLSGTYIIGSDNSMNYNVPSTINVSEIINSVKSDYSDISKYEYFAIIVNGSCSYVAVYKKSDDSNVGAYPILSIPKALNDDRLETEKVSKIDTYTLDELFEIAKDVIG